MHSYAQSLPEKSPSRKDVFIHADVMPQFPGGNDSLIRFISCHLIYPEQAAENGIEGKVLLSVVIDKYGKPRDIIAKGKPDNFLAKEAIRVAKLMPEWTPGMQNDSAVSVQVSIPVNFKLASSR